MYDKHASENIKIISFENWEGDTCLSLIRGFLMLTFANGGEAEI